MRIVIDTNVVISAVFFGGDPRRLLDPVIRGDLRACATPDIIAEYDRISGKMRQGRKGRFHPDLYSAFLTSLSVIDAVSSVAVCRDPDDDKFLACAKDAKALYIVSGDKDLLDIQEFEGIEILTVREFCARYLDLRDPREALHVET